MVYLQKMTVNEFSSFKQQEIQSYAKEKQQTEHISLPKAINLAEDTFQSLLPNGIDTEENYLYTVQDENKTKGHIWLATYQENPEIAFIYDVLIYPPFQNQGLGTKTIVLAEQKMKKHGYKFLQLHVFGSNKRAIHVYKKLGLKAADIVMQKEI